MLSLLVTLLLLPTTTPMRPGVDLDAVATRLVGHSVSVLCGADAGVWAEYGRGRFGRNVLGFAVVGGNEVYLAPGLCATLGRPVAPRRHARFAFVLAHELAHAAGVAGEARADAVAGYWMWPILRALGYQHGFHGAG